MMKFASFLFLTICVFYQTDAAANPLPPPHPKAPTLFPLPKTALDSVLADYDRLEIPGGFANVSVDVFLRSVFLETKNDVPYMRVVFTLRQYWKDPGLVQDKDESNKRNITLTRSEDMGRLWTPDTFEQNDAYPQNIRFDGHSPSMIKFSPSAQVWSSIVVQKSVFCPVKTELKTKDEVKCYLKFASFGHTEDQIKYHWVEEKTQPNMEWLGPAFPEFTFDVKHEEYSQKTKTGDYSSLKMIFTWRKK